jgi:SAM-dependent methyltransferase
MSPQPLVFDENYYSSVYPNYKLQNPPRKLHFYRDLVAKHLGNRKSPAVLDMGCAFGAFVSVMPKEWDRYGTDVSEFAIERAKATVPGAKFAAGILETCPFPGPFDAITAFDVVEHIPDIEGIRKQIHARLKPGGIFVFVVPVYDGPLGWVVEALDKDPTHVHKTRRDWWLSWAQQSFDVLEWQGAYRYLTPLKIYVHYRSRLLRSWSPAIVVAARRR